jgi:uncharacterized protein (TIGR02996 family)
MNDGDALLAAILANPDDDTPRLVYADWLQENGQPERAEFIRLQLQLLNAYTPEDDARQDGLLDKHLEEWTAHLPTSPEDGPWGPRWEWDFVRGMPERLSCDAEAYFEHRERLTSATTIRELVLNDASGGWLEELASVGWPATVVSLTLQECPKTPVFVHGYDCASGYAALARLPQLRQLRELGLHIYHLSQRAVEAIVATPHLDALERLFLGHCWLSEDSVELLRGRFGSGFSYLPATS